MTSKNSLPHGFRLAGVACGIKASGASDITLIVSEKPCIAAGVYTQNQVVAAPVVLDRLRTPLSHARAVVVNSGNANACTGPQGMADAEQMLAVTARHVGCNPEDVLVMSTGIIGELLPMDKVEQGIEAAAADLGDTEDHIHAAAKGILTTDTVSKVSEATVADHRILGFAKGSGMIAPNMATMLGVVLTDATLTPEDAQALLAQAAEKSFNSIHVDGHTSTNDTVLLLASGQSEPESEPESEPLSGEALETFSRAFEETCIDLAKQIVSDGEGASHLVEIVVHGAESDADAKQIAQTIANSPLVKTAFAGNDPNWGRIVSAAGYSGCPIDIANTSLLLNETLLFENGVPCKFDAFQVSTSMQATKEMTVDLCVGKGSGRTKYWTCDLTHEYVTINADYHT